MRSRATLKVDVGFEQGYADFAQASAMFSSVSVPWPRRVLKARWSFVCEVSNIGLVQCIATAPAVGQTALARPSLLHSRKGVRYERWSRRARRTRRSGASWKRKDVYARAR